MASDAPPVVFDDDNPEWTADDFTRARPIGDIPALAAAFPNGSNKSGRPAGTLRSDRQQVALRIPRPIIDHFKAGGPGWQTRMVEALGREVEKAG